MIYASEYAIAEMLASGVTTFADMYYFEDEVAKAQYLDNLGVLNDRFIAAHLIYVSMEDLEILEKRKVGIAHNIGANAKAGKGVPPLKEMFNRKMKVGLGSDGPMSGNTLDIITQMSLVAKIHKLVNKDRTLFPAMDIVEMATIGGARALILDKMIGSVEPGKKADLVILETSSFS